MKPTRNVPFSSLTCKLASRDPTACRIPTIPLCCGLRKRRSGAGHVVLCKAAQEEEESDTKKSVDMLNKMLYATEKGGTLTGKELRQLVYDKWGRSYDVRIMQRSGSTFMHIMWKYLEQQSFPLTEDEYQEQLDAVAELCSEWGVSEMVRAGIQAARDRGPGISVGGAARAVQITLGKGLDMMGGSR